MTSRKRPAGALVRTPLITALVLLAITSLLAFGWLGWRFYQEPQQSGTALIDRLVESGPLISREIGAELARWETMAGREGRVGDLPPAGTFLVFGAAGVIAVRGEPLAYYPAVAKPDVPADDRLLRAQTAERAGDLDAALTGYRDAATSTARTARAVATAGVGRTLRAKGNLRDALAAYDELAQMDEARIEGHPAPLVAHGERQAVLLAQGDSAAAERERARIELALRARMYIIDRETFEFFAPALGSKPYSKALIARADAVTTELWPRWQATPSGRALAGRPEYAFASVWRPSTAESAAIVAPIDVLMEQAMTVASRLSTTIALESSDGRHIWGETPPTEGSATVTLEDIGLSAKLRLWLTNR